MIRFLYDFLSDEERKNITSYKTLYDTDWHLPSYLHELIKCIALKSRPYDTKQLLVVELIQREENANKIRVCTHSKSIKVIKRHPRVNVIKSQI